jgi:hypothetical protein
MVTYKVFASVVGLVLAWSGVKVYDHAIEAFTTKPIGAVVVDLHFDGMFVHQHIEPQGVPVLSMGWAAKISRGDKPLCSGGGRAPYDGKPDKYTPTEWAGSECPPLLAGDRGVAVWTFIDANGNPASISRSFTVPEV